MIENIIVYFILAVFSLIGLGMSWDQREKAILIKLGFFILAIIALAYLYIADSHYIHIFDMRRLFGFAGEQRPSSLAGRAAILVLFLIIMYMVNALHLLIYFNKHFIIGANKDTNAD